MADVARTVLVVGVGTMGRGIAQACAAAGIRVRLCDVDRATAERGLQGVLETLDRLVARGKLDAAERAAIAARIELASDLESGAADADACIEAVPERIELKLETFARLDRVARPDALLATNTSSLSVTEIAAATSRPDRVVGTHFFNPVPVMELLEVVRGLRTDEATVERAVALGRRLGKTPIVVRDFPGFATSRLGVVLGAEAIRMLEQGVASAEDIDRAMELGYRHPMGPLRLTDLVGLDVRLAILEHLHRELGEAFRPPALLRQMVRAGKLGRKSGEGFYRY
ncbi:MAG: 3-hydroxyacyl-CoA dehydrogenase NAD-binding domain-containing protein [Myxococcota bacterium]|nr:3-hydroxyacyl-CoA dehydrogenase NAD-binding domain-containing protein [Myxococcota bacterium]MDW8361355.1 3-hydroxyacyl-CoA dehydrogenase NAD-binding domain-containing protein [Myxococcales bacterium]